MEKEKFNKAWDLLGQIERKKRELGLGLEDASKAKRIGGITVEYSPFETGSVYEKVHLPPSAVPNMLEILKKSKDFADSEIERLQKEFDNL
jgi:hypothetical protein